MKTRSFLFQETPSLPKTKIKIEPLKMTTKQKLMGVKWINLDNPLPLNLIVSPRAFQTEPSKKSAASKSSENTPVMINDDSNDALETLQFIPVSNVKNKEQTPSDPVQQSSRVLKIGSLVLNMINDESIPLID